MARHRVEVMEHTLHWGKHVLEGYSRGADEVRARVVIRVMVRVKIRASARGIARVRVRVRAGARARARDHGPGVSVAWSHQQGMQGTPSSGCLE